MLAMKWSRIVLPALLAAVACVPAPAQEEPASLLVNGDFEQIEDDQPVGWSFSARQGETAHAVEEVDGAHCLSITVASADEDGTWNQDGIEAAEGVRVYRLAARIRTDLQGCAARVAPVFQGGGKWLGADYTAISVEGRTDWQRHVRLIVAPEGTEQMRLRLWVNYSFGGTGTAWFDDVELVPMPGLETVPPPEYTSGNEMPPLSERDRERGFAVFGRSTLDMALPESLPEAGALDPTLAAFAAPGQLQPMSFCLRSLRELSAVTVRAGALTGPAGESPAAAIEVNHVRCLERMLHRSQADVMVVPTFLERPAPLDIPAERTDWFWVRIAVPEDAAPGQYQGAVTLSVDGQPVREVPLRLEVLPIQLIEPTGKALGFYYLAHLHEDAYTQSLEHFREMRRRGMTSLGLVADLHLEPEEDRPKVIWDAESDLGGAMDAWTEAGFTEPVCWLMHPRVHNFCIKEFGALESEEFGAAYTEIIRQVEARRAERDWPEIIYQPIDEPPHNDQRMAVALRTLPLLQQAGVRTEEDGNLRPGDESFEAMYPHVDVINCNFRRQVEQQKLGTWRTEMLERCRRDDKTVWTYNIDICGYHPEALRFGMGFGIEGCDATGMIEWVYQTRAADPYTVDPERKRTKHFFWYPPVGDETGGPSTGYEGATEGATDARYVATFRAAVAAARASADAEKARLADQALAEYQAELDRIVYTNMRTEMPIKGEWTIAPHADDEGYLRLGGHYKIDNGWSLSDYDRVRRMLAEWILRLNR